MLGMYCQKLFKELAQKRIMSLQRFLRLKMFVEDEVLKTLYYNASQKHNMNICTNYKLIKNKLGTKYFHQNR